MAEYTPDEMTVRSSYFDAASSLHGMDGEETHAEFDRFLARVRRDAAREALCGLRESHAQTVSILAADSQARFYEEKILLRIDRYLDTHHPETEDQT